VADPAGLDVFVLHRRAHEASMREAGGGTVQDYLAGYLIEKSHLTITGTGLAALHRPAELGQIVL
jgi:hypothetical protein